MPLSIDASESVLGLKIVFGCNLTDSRVNFPLQALGRFQCIRGICGQRSRANSVPGTAFRLSD